MLALGVSYLGCTSLYLSGTYVALVPAYAYGPLRKEITSFLDGIRRRRLPATAYVYAYAFVAAYADAFAYVAAYAHAYAYVAARSYAFTHAYGCAHA